MQWRFEMVGIRSLPHLFPTPGRRSGNTSGGSSEFAACSPSYGYITVTDWPVRRPDGGVSTLNPPHGFARRQLAARDASSRRGGEGVPSMRWVEKGVDEGRGGPPPGPPRFYKLTPMQSVVLIAPCPTLLKGLWPSPLRRTLADQRFIVVKLHLEASVPGHQ